MGVSFSAVTFHLLEKQHIILRFYDLFKSIHPLEEHPPTGNTAIYITVSREYCKVPHNRSIFQSNYNSIQPTP